MNMYYPELFSPITIKGREFKNRIFAAPASCHLLCSGTAPNEKVIAYYEQKAKGGAALINFSAQNMDIDRPEDNIHAGDNIFCKENRMQWKRFTDAIHAYDSYTGLELLEFHHHGFDDNGKLINYSVDGTLIDTAESMDRDGRPQPPLPLSEMEKLCVRYADAAEAALLCGFDSILIHGGHGVLLSQFISPLYNKRTDEFGGSAENRARFPVMILKAIRERVGSELLIEYRVSGDELAGKDGFGISDCIDFIKRVQPYIDIAHVSAGGFMSRTEHITHPGIFCEEGCNVKYAEAVKKCPDINIPVLTLGALKTPRYMNDIIKEGKADLVGAARALIADPYLPEKARNGRDEDIIPCVRCMRCTDFIKETSFGCSCNPDTGHELEPLKPGDPGKHVVIIGGGPAGMQAALTSSRRGFRTTLIEKSAKLGGKLGIASMAPFKKELRKYTDFQIKRVLNAGTDVLLETEATPDLVKKLKADAVICTAGSKPFIPPIPGIDSPGTVSITGFYEILPLSGSRIPGSLVVIGGGEAGCETAVYAADIFGIRPAVLEMRDSVCADSYALTRDEIIEQLKKKTDVFTSVNVKKITPDGVSFTDASGIESFIKADMTIIACGMRPEKETASRFKGTASKVIFAGDCERPANIASATRSAADAVISV